MKRVFSVFFLLTINSFLAVAQQQRQEIFEGSFSIIENEEGEARYGFFLNEEGEKVKNGEFVFKSEYLDSAENFFQRRINGFYSNGKKDRKWIYQNNIYSININTVNERFQVQSNVDGTTQRLEANFKNGIAEGQWKLEEYRIEASEQKERTKWLQVNFLNGRMIDNFVFSGYVDDMKTEISGKFSKQHFFDGEWELKFFRDSVEFVEKRVFDNGFLISLIQKDVTNDIVFHEIDNSRVRQKLDNVRRGVSDIDYTIGNDFFGVSFDDGFPLFSEESISQRFGNDILIRVFSILTESGKVPGLDLAGVEKLRPGGTRRFEYTFTAEERRVLDETQTQLAAYASDLEKFVNNTTLSLNRQKSDSLSFSFKLAEKLLSNFKVVENNLDLLMSDSFKYQSKRTYFRSGIEGIASMDTIRYTYDGEEKKRFIENPVDFSDSDKIVFSIGEYVKAKGKIVEELDPFFKEAIIDIEQDMVSQQLEEDLVNSIQEVNDTYDIQRGVDTADEDGVILTRFHVALYANFQRKLDNLMQEYSTAEGFEEKQEKGLEIINMAQIYKEAYEPIGDVRRKLQQLDEAYTKISYNPYMDRHDIKTRIKRNIYFAAIDHLLPDYRDRIIEENEFTEIPGLIEEMNAAFDRLFEIANKPDSETRTIERRLRRESSPNRIKRILDI